MNTSYRIGRIGDIAIEVHATFAILLAWVGLDALFASGSPGVAAMELVFVGLVFGIVLLHELGHAFTARQFGVRTRAITLLPIGGVAQMDGMPGKPWQEMLVALAGPAVNIGLAIVMLPVALGGSWLATRLLWVNVGLALFNLIPAFPMDGGRVLRAALTMYAGPIAATRIAVNVAQVVAVLMGIVGLMGNPMLVLIALFVWFQADREKQVHGHPPVLDAYFEEALPPRVIVRRVVRRPMDGWRG